jgi:alkylhydroperoxidase/carboxymuconolactone decarboxylase family protein YurZ
MPLPTVPIKNIRDHLPPLKLEVLRRAYVRGDALALLNAVLPATYDNALEYSEAVADAFYGGLPEDATPGWRATLSVQDRERCIITLLASRRAELELAIHIYLALMEHVSVEEIANILMLTGMYSGLDNFSRGLRVEAKVLDTLAAIVDENARKDALSVLLRLSQAFEPAPASGT